MNFYMLINQVIIFCTYFANTVLNYMLVFTKPSSSRLALSNRVIFKSDYFYPNAPPHTTPSTRDGSDINGSLQFAESRKCSILPTNLIQKYQILLLLARRDNQILVLNLSILLSKNKKRFQMVYSGCLKIF